MAGISSKAAGKLENKKWKFQNQELDDDLGLNWYGFKWRNHDPQIGRFIQIDPLANEYVYNSTYAFSENKVTNDIELEGLESMPAAFRAAVRSTGYSPEKTSSKAFVQRLGQEFTKVETYGGAIDMVGQLTAPVALAVLTDGFLSGTSMMAEGAAIRSGTMRLPEIKPTAIAETGVQDAAMATPKSAPNYIVDSKGTAYPVPEGATGPTPVESGKGVQFTGGKGGTNGQVAGMRIMDPVAAKGKAPGYPDGYIKYTNAQGQGVNSYTGQTGSKAATHFPINGNTTPPASDATRVAKPIILPPNQ